MVTTHRVKRSIHVVTIKEFIGSILKVNSSGHKAEFKKSRIRVNSRGHKAQSSKGQDTRMVTKPIRSSSKVNSRGHQSLPGVYRWEQVP